MAVGKRSGIGGGSGGAADVDAGGDVDGNAGGEADGVVGVVYGT